MALFAKHLPKDLAILYCSSSIRRQTYILVFFHCRPSIRHNTLSFCIRPNVRRAFAESIRLHLNMQTTIGIHLNMEIIFDFSKHKKTGMCLITCNWFHIQTNKLWKLLY